MGARAATVMRKSERKNNELEQREKDQRVVLDLMH